MDGNVFLPFAVAWIDLENTVLNGVCQTEKTDAILFCLHVVSKEPNIQNRIKLINTINI